MHKAKITFSDGSTLVLAEDEVLIGVSLSEGPEPYPSISSSTRLENSFHDGLIPSILEVTCQYPYFYGPSGIETIYSSSAIVKIDII